MMSHGTFLKGSPHTTQGAALSIPASTIRSAYFFDKLLICYSSALLTWVAGEPLVSGSETEPPRFVLCVSPSPSLPRKLLARSEPRAGKRGAVGLSSWPKRRELFCTTQRQRRAHPDRAGRGPGHMDRPTVSERTRQAHCKTARQAVGSSVEKAPHGNGAKFGSPSTLRSLPPNV